MELNTTSLWYISDVEFIITYLILSMEITDLWNLFLWCLQSIRGLFTTPVDVHVYSVSPWRHCVISLLVNKALEYPRPVLVLHQQTISPTSHKLLLCLLRLKLHHSQVTTTCGHGWCILDVISGCLWPNTYSHPVPLPRTTVGRLLTCSLPNLHICETHLLLTSKYVST